MASKKEELIRKIEETKEELNKMNLELMRLSHEDSGFNDQIEYYKGKLVRVQTNDEVAWIFGVAGGEGDGYFKYYELYGPGASFTDDECFVYPQIEVRNEVRSPYIYRDQSHEIKEFSSKDELLEDFKSFIGVATMKEIRKKRD